MEKDLPMPGDRLPPHPAALKADCDEEPWIGFFRIQAGVQRKISIPAAFADATSVIFSSAQFEAVSG